MLDVYNTVAVAEDKTIVRNQYLPDTSRDLALQQAHQYINTCVIIITLEI